MLPQTTGPSGTQLERVETGAICPTDTRQGASKSVVHRHRTGESQVLSALGHWGDPGPAGILLVKIAKQLRPNYLNK